MAVFQLVGYLKLLADHDVTYVIVGGVGSRIQGSATTTQDLDIMPDPSPENLERLAATLSSPNTTKKAEGSTSYAVHPLVEAMEFRTAAVSSFQTTYGAIDVLMELPGVGAFDQVRKNAKPYQFESHVLLVATLDDIITSKETSDRAKDWRAMDALYEARDRLRQAGDPYELTDDQLNNTATDPDIER